MAIAKNKRKTNDGDPTYISAYKARARDSCTPWPNGTTVKKSESEHDFTERTADLGIFTTEI
jgi:hypothetical protein